MNKATNQIQKLQQGRQTLVAAARGLSGRSYHALIQAVQAFGAAELSDIGQAELNRLVAEAVQSVRPARGVRFNFSTLRAA